MKKLGPNAAENLLEIFIRRHEMASIYDRASRLGLKSTFTLWTLPDRVLERLA